MVILIGVVLPLSGTDHHGAAIRGTAAFLMAFGAKRMRLTQPSLNCSKSGPTCQVEMTCSLCNSATACQLKIDGNAICGRAVVLFERTDDVLEVPGI